MLSEQLKSDIKRRLVERFNLKKIIIFGSQATGRADSRSDVDLLIVTSKIENRLKLMRDIRSELLSFEYAFDVVALTLDEYEQDKFIPGTVSRYASLEGVVLYES
jgi:uncharacterized protein